MPETELDLGELENGAAGGTAGAGSKPDGEQPARKRGRPKGSTSRRSSSRVETEIGSRLERVLDRVAESLEGRGDEELAGVIREDSQAITGSVVSMTRPFAPARQVVIAALAILEPLVAFARIGRILGGRLAARRQARAEAQAIADAEAAGVPVVPADAPAY